jgi:peptide/nickel transport system permease protein
MFKYIVRRVLIFIPTLFAISLIAFAISVNAPGDPVEIMTTGAKGGEGAGALNEGVVREKAKLRHELGLDLPVFYVSLSNIASPDTLFKIYDKPRRESLERLIHTYGNWEQISQWYQSLLALDKSAKSIAPDSSIIRLRGDSAVNVGLSDIRQEIMSLFLSQEDVVIQAKFKKIDAWLQADRNQQQGSFLQPLTTPIKNSQAAFEEMKALATSWKTWIPSLKFYSNNQYHQWFFGDGNWLTGAGAIYTEGVIRGDFGRSYATKQDVTKTIKRAIPWSLFFSLTSVVLAYLISIPIGVKAASKRGSFFDRASSVTLFMLYSMPTFFMGTLLLLTFSNPDIFNWFEVNGVKPSEGYPDGATWWEKAKISLPYIVLPLICYTYSSLAFLSRTMRVSMLEIVNQDFIRTARAKGLPERVVIYKHGLRNALLPIITVFSNIFPAAIGGSVVLEFLFGIPGMGQEIMLAIQTKDYPMIVCVFSLSGFMTLVGYLFADILYAIVDPRISYSQK